MKPSSLPNLGPVSERWLAEIGIHTAADLKSMGAEAAFHRLRFVFGQRITLNALYSLEGAVIGCDWRSIPENRKQELRWIAGRKPPGGR